MPGLLVALVAERSVVFALAINPNNASGHSVPQIASDSAGDSWLPFFIGGMLALACAAAALVFFRNRRRTASG